MYRNDEYGFEFWYPKGWSVLENTYGSLGTRFNVIAFPEESNGKHPDLDPLLVAVVDLHPHKGIRAESRLSGNMEKRYGKAKELHECAETLCGTRYY